VSSIAVSSTMFACVFGGSLVAMRVRRRLPEHHLNSESKDVVKLGMGLIATLSALVLGLLISAAKGTYDAQSNAVKELSAKVILTDGLMAKYGSETKECRELLRQGIAATTERLWPEDDHLKANLTPGEARAALEAAFDKVAAFSPRDDAQRALRGRLIDLLADLASARIRLFSQQETALPVPLLVVLVFWLSILFFGYGLLAADNGTVVAILFVCAASVSAAVFLMLELTTPFTGIMRVSGKPLRDALALIGQ
jgi:hypothetical protein